MSTVPSEDQTFFAKPGGSTTPQPSCFLSSDQLMTTCNLLLASTEAPTELLKLCVSTHRLVLEYRNSGFCLRTLMISKMKDIQQALHVPARPTGGSRRPLAEQQPLLLLDRLLDLFGTIAVTAGLWNFSGQDATLLSGQLDTLLVAVGEVHKRLTRQLRTQQKDSSSHSDERPMSATTNQAKDDTTVLTAELLDGIQRAATLVSSTFCTSLQTARSLLGNHTELMSSDPLVAALCQVVHSEKERPRLESSGLPASEQLLKENLSSFVNGVLTAGSSTVCTQVLASYDMHNVIAATQGLRAGLQEFARQRAFEWSSATYQARLPHNYITLPDRDSLLLGSKIKTQTTLPKLPIPNDHAEAGSSSSSSSLDSIRKLLCYHLGSLSHALTGVYKRFGSMLGGPYEDPRGQQDLVTASVIGLYMSLVGFIFVNDLQELAHWMSPLLPKIRRSIRQQSAPVNVHPETVEIESNENAAPAVAQPVSKTTSGHQQSIASTKSNPAITAFLSAVSSPQDITFMRTSEAEIIVNFFMPHLKKASRGTPMAPADRINRLLVWLAWEGDLLSLYSRLVSEATTDTTHPDVSQIMEDAIVEAILLGVQSVQTKFADATDLFTVPDVATADSVGSQALWSGRGDDVIEFCQRIMEALSLRFLGELELKAPMRDNDKCPRWKTSLLTYWSRCTLPPKSQQTSVKLTEGLPKFLCDFCHQTVFYHCPVGRVARSLPEAGGLSTAVANASAATSRLIGLVADMDARITGAEYLGEASVLNTHENRRSLMELEAGLTNLKQQFQAHVEGTSERHSNQLRTHNSRLEEHQGDIRKNAGIMTTQQTVMNRLAEDIRRLSEGSAEVRAIFEASKADQEARGDPAKYGELLKNAESRLKSRLETLEIELRNLEKNLRTHQEEYKSHTTQAEILMKTLQRKMDDTGDLCNLSVLEEKIQAATSAYVDAELTKRVEGLTAACDDQVLTKRIEAAVEAHTPHAVLKQLESALAACSEEAIKKRVEKATAGCTTDVILRRVEKAAAACSEEALAKRIEQAAASWSPDAITKTIEQATAAYSEEAIREKIADATKGYTEEMVKRVTEEARVAAAAETLKKFKDIQAQCEAALSENRTAQSTAFEQLRQEIEAVKATLERLQTELKTQTHGFVEAVIKRTRRELSAYLTENLSQCVSNHVLYHLEQQQQHQHQKRRFLAWTLPARNTPSTTPDAASMADTTSAIEANTASPKARNSLRSSNTRLRHLPAPLIRSTHRLPGRDDFDGVADAVSVTEEASVCQEGLEESWFPREVVLLDLPETRNERSMIHVGSPRTDGLDGHTTKTATSLTPGRLRTFSAVDSPQAKRISELHQFSPSERAN